MKIEILKWSTVWYDNKLFNLKNRRNRAHRKLLNRRLVSGAVADDTVFLEAKTEFESYQNELYNGFLRDLASNYKRQPKRFWNYINSKYKKTALPATMFYNSASASNDLDKASLFAQFFSFCV